MAGLWCVNIGYGRKELAEVAARQMEELAYYNTFFQTTHVPAIALAAKIAELAPGDLNHVFFAGSGSEANDTNIRLVRRYWDIKGKPGKAHHHLAQERLSRLDHGRRLAGRHDADPRPWRHDRRDRAYRPALLVGRGRRHDARGHSA